MKKYTIESISNEGIYYLVNHWDKHKKIWARADELLPSMLFTAPKFAKASLTKLIKAMPEYKTDKFILIEVIV